MNGASCWGIFREREHSPGRESDDAEILRLTGKHLEADGFEVRLKSPDEVLAPVDDRPRFVFSMCEGLGALVELGAWEAGGVRQVNRPGAVLKTYRARMIALLDAAGVPFVRSRIVRTAGFWGPVSLPVWVKRPDVHATEAGDVVFATTERGVGDALERLAARGIRRAVIQGHIEGDLVKFYGIGGGRGGEPPWFRWYYPDGQRVAGHPLDPRRLRRLARRAAAALGLEVYGGDAIARANGDLVLLDLNAWPSFARYREDAAARIAIHLARRFSGGPR